MKRILVLISAVFLTNIGFSQNNTFIYADWEICLDTKICPPTPICYFISFEKKDNSYRLFKEKTIVDKGYFELVEKDATQYEIYFSSTKDKLNSFLDNKMIHLFRNKEKLVFLVEEGTTNEQLYVLTKN